MSELIETLHAGRAREREQAAFYRSLAGQAEDRGDALAAERLNGLLADEQHHVSRLTARLLELGESLAPEPPVPVAVPELDAWEAPDRAREAGEVAWYEEAIRTVTDDLTLVILAEILESERHHHEDLGGKWMPAEPPGESTLP